MDEYVEYEEAGGCIERIKSALAGLLLAPILIVAAIGLLFWNEGRAVKRARDLEQGRSQVIKAEADSRKAANDGKLVHVRGDMSVDETLADTLTGIEKRAVKLQRTVEMYQWEEDKDTETVKRNGKKVEKTTYSYQREWSSSHNDSRDFKRKKGHRNPSSIPYESKTYQARNVTMGDYVIGRELLDKVTDLESLSVDSKVTENLPEQYRSRASVSGDTIYLSGRSSSPKVGDVRIRYSYMAPQPVSVVAAQAGDTLSPYGSEELNGQIGLIQLGKHTADSMFSTAESNNTALTWGLRFGGWLAMLIGFSLLFGPIEAIVGSIPLIGWFIEDLIEVGTLLVSGALASGLSLLVVAIGWIFYRPLLGIALLLLAALLIGGIAFLAIKNSSRRTAAT